MSDIRLNRLANVLVNYSTKVKAGDWVHVNANWQAIPLVKEVVAYILKVGGNPSVSLESSDLNEVFMSIIMMMLLWQLHLLALLLFASVVKIDKIEVKSTPLLPLLSTHFLYLIIILIE